MLVELVAFLVLKMCAVVFFSPIFLFPAMLVAFFGAVVGNIFMKAQLSVKREMSNAKAPVLGHFGAAISGISECLPSSSKWKGLLTMFHSVHTCVWRAERVQGRGIQTHRQVQQGCHNTCQPQPVRQTFSSAKLSYILTRCYSADGSASVLTSWEPSSLPALLLT